MEGKRVARTTQIGSAQEELNNCEITLQDYNNFHILYTNADCFTNKRDDLVLLLGTLSYKPSVIVITEINSKFVGNNLLSNDFNLCGFNLFTLNVSVPNKRGILIYINTSLYSVQFDLVQKFDEYLFIKIRINTGSNLILGAFYRSPSSAAINDQNLLKLIDSLTLIKQDKILLIGDFNFPSINWSNKIVGTSLSVNSIAYKFISCLKDNYLTQHVHFPTRARGSQTPHTLDLVITNDDFVEEIANLSPLGKSDHSVLHCVCNLHAIDTVHSTKSKLNKGDYKSFSDYMALNIGDSFYSDHISINDSWISLKYTLLSGQELFIPHVVNKDWKKKDWRFPTNSSFRQLIRKKHRCWTRFQRDNDKKYLNEFKRLRNLVRKESRLITQKNQREIALNCKSNPKKFWQHIRSRTVSLKGIGDLKVADGASSKIVSSDIEKAEIFSEYFERIFTIETSDDFVRLPGAPLNDIFSIKSFSESQVAHVLGKIKVSKSPGPDLLHPRVIYELRDVLVGPLKHLFNRSLFSGVLPDEWKTSHVSVLHKKGEKDCIENYRPISLTCICCKLMESLVRDIVMYHFVSNNLFSDKQYGFIKGRSTVLQLLKLTDSWSNSLDDNVQVDIIYTDFEKAFDKVPHQRLLSKLKSYGLNELIVDWIRAFLLLRSQRVKINGVLSEYKHVLSGIPQGSVLGPLLFVIYINDLPSVCDSSSDLFLFADDAKLYKCIKSDNDFITLNRVCQELFNWSE